MRVSTVILYWCCLAFMDAGVVRASLAEPIRDSSSIGRGYSTFDGKTVASCLVSTNIIAIPRSGDDKGFSRHIRYEFNREEIQKFFSAGASAKVSSVVGSVKANFETASSVKITNTSYALIATVNLDDSKYGLADSAVVAPGKPSIASSGFYSTCGNHYVSEATKFVSFEVVFLATAQTLEELRQAKGQFEGKGGTIQAQGEMNDRIRTFRTNRSTNSYMLMHGISPVLPKNDADAIMKFMEEDVNKDKIRPDLWVWRITGTKAYPDAQQFHDQVDAFNKLNFWNSQLDGIRSDLDFATDFDFAVWPTVLDTEKKVIETSLNEWELVLGGLISRCHAFWEALTPSGTTCSEGSDHFKKKTENNSLDITDTNSQSIKKFIADANKRLATQPLSFLPIVVNLKGFQKVYSGSKGQSVGFSFSGHFYANSQDAVPRLATNDSDFEYGIRIYNATGYRDLNASKYSKPRCIIVSPGEWIEIYTRNKRSDTDDSSVTDDRADNFMAIVADLSNVPKDLLRAGGCESVRVAPPAFSH